MANFYCTDDDLEKFRPNIFQLGQSDWDDQKAEAKLQIDRTLDTRWYRGAAASVGVLAAQAGSQFGKTYVDWRLYPYNADLLLNAVAQLTRLGTFKTLELIYLYLMNDAPEPDAFDKQRKIFKDMYKDELEMVLANGLDYDWDASGGIDLGEANIPKYRRLQRA